MADVMNVGVNLEAFSQAINAIQALRSSVTRVFDSLKDGMKNKETLEGREKAFIAEFQDNLQSVNRDLTELERLSNLVGRPSESHPLHNSGLLSLDPVQDKTPLYSQLLQAYKWSNKLQYHAGLASSLLNQQSLKRSANQIGASAKRRPKVQPSTLVLPIQYVDDVISRIGRMFPDMSIELFRPNGTSAVLLKSSWFSATETEGARMEMKEKRRGKGSKRSWQLCQEDYKCPFPSRGTLPVHAHRAHSARWPSWQAGPLGRSGGHLCASSPTRETTPQFTTKL
ncbi:mediator of RNA polymerase II transcription subunit 27 isoform X2 [Pygocentrus nattereri]|nr:mediator of RNA polymerase II transcription subunit 27 isoform X2 [Pygocentrus nattereri]